MGRWRRVRVGVRGGWVGGGRFGGVEVIANNVSRPLRRCYRKWLSVRDVGVALAYSRIK